MPASWAEMMQAAVRMGISPEGFWRLSLKEWRMLTVAVGGAVPMGRGDFQRMAERWPDSSDPLPAGEGLSA